jgi:hypothetical protein
MLVHRKNPRRFSFTISIITIGLSVLYKLYLAKKFGDFHACLVMTSFTIMVAMKFVKNLEIDFVHPQKMNPRNSLASFVTFNVEILNASLNIWKMFVV